MDFDLSQVGQWTDERVMLVTESMTTQFAAATNDANEMHLSGDLAPPLFAAIPSLMGVMTTALWSVAISERQGYDTRPLHAEHDLILKRPIRPGMTLFSRAAVVGVHRKSSGTMMITKTEARDEPGDLVNHQYYSTLIRGVFAEQEVGDLPPPRPNSYNWENRDPIARVTLHVDSDQSLRYAAASGDDGTPHLDEKAATEAGLPGMILHGFCTMAFCSRAIVGEVCNDASSRLRRLAVRFTKPVTLDQDLKTAIWEEAALSGHRVFSFSVRDEIGDLVITRGLAEVAE